MTFHRDRLIKLLGLLGSDQDGERANAARMANDLVRAAGLTWADVIVRTPASPTFAKSRDRPDPPRRPGRSAAEPFPPPHPARHREAFGWTARDLASRVAAVAHRTQRIDDFLRTLEAGAGLTDAEWETLAGMARDAGIDLERPPRHRSFR